MRWLSERSGAIDCLGAIIEDIVSVAAGMGGESTLKRASIKVRAENSAQPRVEVKLCRGWWTVLSAGLQGFSALTDRVIYTYEPSIARKPRAIRAPAPGSRKLSVPTATRRAPTSSRSR